jgi:hypothetical protein
MVENSASICGTFVLMGGAVEFDPFSSTYFNDSYETVYESGLRRVQMSNVAGFSRVPIRVRR